MKAVFVDTAYYLALLNENDELHAAAVAAIGQLPNRAITTSWILTEVADAMCRLRHRRLAADFLRDLKQDSRLTIVSPSSELWDRGFELFSSRADKEWSLTDCISFIVMELPGLTEVLTSDHHFKQAGFTVLMQ